MQMFAKLPTIKCINNALNVNALNVDALNVNPSNVNALKR